MRPIRGALALRRLGIDTYQEAVVFMNRDCHVCRAEGFSGQRGCASRLAIDTSSQRWARRLLGMILEFLLELRRIRTADAQYLPQLLNIQDREQRVLDSQVFVACQARPVKRVGETGFKLIGRRIGPSALGISGC
jgi:hypothetical protein